MSSSHLNVSILVEGRGGCSKDFEEIPGFWSCSQDFGVKCGNVLELLRKVFKKGFLNPILKKGLCFTFSIVFV